VGDLILKTKRNQSVLRPICNGQDQTKKMSVAVYNHYKRLMQQPDDEVEKKATSSWWDKQEQENIGG
jgi:ATP-dependent Clp protease ATP-binding subunit ClpX